MQLDKRASGSLVQRHGVPDSGIARQTGKKLIAVSRVVSQPPAL
jgi:hypothetical protein